MKQRINAVGDEPNAAQGRQGVLVLLFRALYGSKRRQAERTLQRYRDVIGQAQRRIRRALIAHSGTIDPERASGRRLEERRPVPHPAHAVEDEVWQKCGSCEAADTYS